MSVSLLELIVFILSPLGALGVAAFVMGHNPRAWTNRWLALGLAVMGVHQALLAASAGADSAAGRLLLMRAALAFAVLIPPSWLAFSLTYGAKSGGPRGLGWRPTVVGLAAAVPLAWAALATGRVVELRWLGEGQLLIGLDEWGKVFFSVYLIGLAVVLLHLENLYRSAGRETRWQIKFLVVGVFVAFSCQIVALSYALLYRVIHPLHPFFGGLAFLVGEGMIAFSLVRHRLLNVDIFVSRYVIYRSLTLALIGGYLFSLGVVAEIFRRLNIPLDLLSGTVLSILGAAALALLLLSDRVRRKTMSVIHAHFYRHKYDYRREWMEYTRQLSRAVTAPAVATQTVQRILDLMWVRQAAMYVAGESPDQMTLLHQVGYTALPSRLEIPLSLQEALRDQARVIPSSAAADEAPDAAGPLLREMFREVPVGCCVPVAGLDALAGLLLVGPEASGQPFGVDDRDLLAAMAAQAGALLVNARLAQEAMEGREFQALARVSAFVVHDLKNTVSMLAMLAENASRHLAKPEFQADAIRTLQEAVGRMRALMAALAAPDGRQGDGVRPLTLDASVEAWMGELAGQVPARIRVETRLQAGVEVAAHPEQLRSVLQNLVLNAVEATPGEGLIRVETARAEAAAVLSVADTGRGMSREFLQGRLFRPFQTTKARGLGIGLYQCRHILHAFGGSLTAESEEGRGTRMIVRLPVSSPEDRAAEGGAAPGKARSEALAA